MDGMRKTSLAGFPVPCLVLAGAGLLALGAAFLAPCGWWTPPLALLAIPAAWLSLWLYLGLTEEEAEAESWVGLKEKEAGETVEETVRLLRKVREAAGADEALDSCLGDIALSLRELRENGQRVKPALLGLINELCASYLDIADDRVVTLSGRKALSEMRGTFFRVQEGMDEMVGRLAESKRAKASVVSEAIESSLKMDGLLK